MNDLENYSSDDQLLNLLEQMQTEAEDKDRQIQKLSSEKSSLQSALLEAKRKIQQQADLIEKQNESDNALKQNRELEKKLNEKQKELKSKEYNLMIMDGAVKKKEIEAKEYHEYAMNLEQEKEKLIKEEGARLVAKDRAELKNHYDSEYKKKANTQDTILGEMTILFFLFISVALFFNDGFLDEISRYFDFSEKMMPLSIFHCVVLLALVVWTVLKFRDKYTSYTLVAICSFMVNGADWMWKKEINSITIGMWVYIAYGVLRMVLKIEDEEERKKTATIIALCVGLFIFIIWAMGELARGLSKFGGN